MARFGLFFRIRNSKIWRQNPAKYDMKITKNFHNGCWIVHLKGLLLFQLQCCGLSNYTDWQATPWGKGHPNKLPHSCCLSTTEAVCTDNKEKASLHRRVSKKYLVELFDG
jgi:hypothetical protein